MLFSSAATIASASDTWAVPFSPWERPFFMHKKKILRFLQKPENPPAVHDTGKPPVWRQTRSGGALRP